MPSADEIIQIDEDDLGAEWAAQPGLMYKWSVKLADARHEHAQLEARLDILEAELFLAARETPSEFNLGDKPNLDTIKAAVKVHEDYQRAVKKLNDAKHTVDVIGAAVEAIKHKKSSLEKLVELHATNYYSEPKLPKGRPEGPANGAYEAIHNSTKKATRRGAKRKARP